MVKRKAASARGPAVRAALTVGMVGGLTVAVQVHLLPPLFGRGPAALQRAVFWGCLLLRAHLVVVALGPVMPWAVESLRTGPRLDTARLKVRRRKRPAEPAALRRAREILSNRPQGKASNGTV